MLNKNRNCELSANLNFTCIQDTLSSCAALGCMQDTFARATHSAARPSARATTGYLVYNALGRICVARAKVSFVCKIPLLTLVFTFQLILSYKLQKENVV